MPKDSSSILKQPSSCAQLLQQDLELLITWMSCNYNRNGYTIHNNNHINIHMMTLFVISCYAILHKICCHLKVFLLFEAFTIVCQKIKMIVLASDIASY